MQPWFLFILKVQTSTFMTYYKSCSTLDNNNVLMQFQAKQCLKFGISKEEMEQRRQVYLAEEKKYGNILFSP